jgi:hypothetical protein
MNQAIQSTSPANENTERSLSTVESAKRIREELKKLGWSSRKVSVRSDSFSMGSSITVKVLVPEVPLAKVKAIAERFERVSRDERTGEILSGGNRYLHVEYSYEVLDAAAAPILAKLPTADGEFVEIYGYDVTRNDRDTYLASRREESGFSIRAYGPESAARQIATKLLDAGIDPSTGSPFIVPERG